MALITEGAAGIGRATALRSANQGATVAIADISEPQAGKVVRELKTVGSQVGAFMADVSRAADCGRAATLVARTFGRLDVLETCAGFGAGGTIMDRSGLA